jgi:hypothetical protein
MQFIDRLQQVLEATHGSLFRMRTQVRRTGKMIPEFIYLSGSVTLLLHATATGYLFHFHLVNSKWNNLQSFD